jgi:hypothetical protein
MRRILLSALAITWSAAALAYAQSIDTPQTVTLEGATAPLVRAGQALRVHLLGSFELYTIAVYLDGPADRTRLISSDVGKALRIEIKYKDDLSRRRPSIDWQGELIPRLERDAMTLLRGAFAPLRYGDVVLVEYVPIKGTTVRINRGVAVSGAHHDLMLAFLDHWIGQQPVSEDVKRSLLASSGSGSGSG